MKETKDPRMLRTRQRIMVAFIDLSSKVEFKDITIKDITEAAQMNRSTFYYHFTDIYDLLDKALTEVLLINLSYEDYEKQMVNEEAIIHIFEAITNFQNSLSNRCHRGYEETIARNIREQLEVIFMKMFRNQSPDSEETAQKRMATFLSWGMYGISAEWRRSGYDTDPKEYIKPAIPYLLKGTAGTFGSGED